VGRGKGIGTPLLNLESKRGEEVWAPAKKGHSRHPFILIHREMCRPWGLGWQYERGRPEGEIPRKNIGPGNFVQKGRNSRG